MELNIISNPKTEIHCPECNGDKFNLTETDMDSLTIACSICGLSITLGAGMTIRNVIHYLKHNSF